MAEDGSVTLENTEYYIFTDQDGRFIANDLLPGDYAFDVPYEGSWILYMFSVGDNREEYGNIMMYEPDSIFIENSAGILPSQYLYSSNIRLVDYPYTRTIKLMYTENTGAAKISVNKSELAQNCLIVISPVFNTNLEQCWSYTCPILVSKNGEVKRLFEAFQYHPEVCSLIGEKRVMKDDNGRFLFLASYFMTIIVSIVMYTYSSYKKPKQSQKNQIKL